MVKDLTIYETGDGGDFCLSNGDLMTTDSFSNQVYLALFGGNKEASTTGYELQGEPRYDWWANQLFFKDLKDKQFNSVTEKTLNEVTLNSSGRLAVIRAVEDDLAYLKKISNINVDVIFETSNKIVIFVKLKKPNENEDYTMKILWDNFKKEAIIERMI